MQPKLHPLHDLLQKGRQFVWSKECQDVFDECKRALMGSPMLSFYDPSKEISIVTDACEYGVGAVLNVVVDNEERPIYMVSATLSPAERNYAQLHREALAIVFAVKKFHKYIFGLSDNIYTDCRSLESLLSGKKDLGTILNSRFLRWILFLLNYDIKVKFRPSNKTQNADALSRLPVNEPTGVDEVSLNLFSLNMFNTTDEELVDHELIGSETQKDPLCQSIYKFILKGWPDKSQLPSGLEYFYKVRLSLDLQDHCFYFGDRIYIPPSLRERVLAILHKEHIGITKCKQIARSFVWWPLIDKDIEYYASQCKACQCHIQK